MTAPPTSLAESLQDRYVLERELGRGGMATVYLARDVKHDRPVAIKVLRSELSAALGPERFHREIHVAGKLQHPNILSLYDSGEAEGTLYYVMPYVEGQSLRDRLEREGQLPLDDALRIAREVADALEYAHRHDVLHRDVKPENILLSGGHALVADFGIARAITVAGGEKLTVTGIAVGTPAYMSPEQATAETRVDGRSDVYSLGCVLYEMVAGEPPFTGPSAQAIVARKLTDPVRPLRTVRDSVPEALERVILKALARLAADRFATASQLADALERANAEVVALPRRSKRSLPARLAWLTVLRTRGAVIALSASAAVLGLSGWLWVRQSRVHWARTVALPEAVKLDGQGRRYAAVRLLRQAEARIPDEPRIRDLLTEWTAPVSVQTTPSGARVYVRDFFDPPSTWEFLGSSPMDGVRLPLANLVWKISLRGFQTEEILGFTTARTLQFSLAKAAGAPPGMVPVRGTPSLALFSLSPVRLEDYWIDKYEVTNRQFRDFVTNGGYQKREYWTEPLIQNGRTVRWEDIQQRFRDRTGRPGPATWEVGTYADGQDNYPVDGVSWYEAAAYCASVGKALPTLYHWYFAADPGSMTEFARFGNFQTRGPAVVGHPLRLGPNGTYDMAGKH